MKNSILVMSLLSGTVLIVPDITIASGILTHTHTNTPELKPASPFAQTEKSFKLASVCFLGDNGCGSGSFSKGDGDYNIDTVKQCLNEGFTITSCTLPTYPNGACSYNENYFAKCAEDKPRACKEKGFTVLSCGIGEVVDTSCPYDGTYKKCKCDPCSGYDYTYAQATAQGYVTDGSCQSCSTTKYKRKANPCSGYQTCECGGTSGASVCYSGSSQKFNSCKSCDPCPGYYDCGGNWQYCEGATCSADSSKCSSYCVSDYFPNSCSSAADCNGVYRNGYCSGSCAANYPYYCSYASLCSKAGGDWGSNSCSVPCYIYIYNYDNYRCEGSRSSWSIMADQNDYCVDENSGSKVLVNVAHQPYYDCRYRTYSSKSSCQSEMSACIDAMRQNLSSDADNYPACARYRGYFVTDIYCH